MSEIVKVLVLKRHPEDEEYVGFWAEFEGERSVPTKTREVTIRSFIRSTSARRTTPMRIASILRTKATPGSRITRYTLLRGMRALGTDARTSRRCGTKRR